MKIVRFQDSIDLIRHGVMTDDGTVMLLEGELFGEHRVSTQKADVKKLLSPLLPATIACIGLNYRKHAAETGATIPQWPVLFYKSVSTLQHPQDPILLPTTLASYEVDFECELAVVIGKTCKNVKKAEALDYVLGYTCGNDVSARDWQKQIGGGQWCRGKSFDTFCPLGPWIVTKDEIPNPNALQISTAVNGEVLQDAHTSDMIFDVATLIEFLSGSSTLLPGTVILTGTPSGVGMARTPQRWLQSGDQVTITIEGIGQLTNPVLAEPSGAQPETDDGAAPTL